MLQKKIDAHETMYGITTGIGEFSEVTLNPDQTQEFQKLLIYWKRRINFIESIFTHTIIHIVGEQIIRYCTMQWIVGLFA